MGGSIAMCQIRMVVTRHYPSALPGSSILLKGGAQSFKTTVIAVLARSSVSPASRPPCVVMIEGISHDELHVMG